MLLRPMFRLAACGALSTLLVGLVPAALAQDAQTPTDLCASAAPVEPATREFAAPEEVLEAGVDYRAVLCTSAGPVYVDLFEELTPVTVNSFVFLAQQGFYDNTTFHRVIQDFMAQGGDPTGTGTGGPGYQFQDEPVGFLTFDQPGWLAMANAGPGTNGSQFFITTAPTDWLNYQHTIFGQVLEGQENVTNIELRDPATASTPGTTLDTVVIVTDPTTVTTTFEAPAAATQEEVAALIDEALAQVPAELLTIEEQTGVITTDEAVAAAPEAQREALATLYAENGHEYRAQMAITNATCDLEQVPYIRIAYALDAFESAEAAAAALENGALNDVALAQGFTAAESESLAQPVYTQADSSCETEATRALTYWQRGRFIATAEATFPANSEIPADVWLTRLVGVQVFENLLAPVLLPEIQ